MTLSSTATQNSFSLSTHLSLTLVVFKHLEITESMCVTPPNFFKPRFIHVSLLGPGTRKKIVTILFFQGIPKMGARTLMFHKIQFESSFP